MQVVQREQPAVAVQVVDRLVYPAKDRAVAAAASVESINLKTMWDKVTAFGRVIDLRAPLTSRLSLNSGYPTIAGAGGLYEVGPRPRRGTRSRRQQAGGGFLACQGGGVAGLDRTPSAAPSASRCRFASPPATKPQLASQAVKGFRPVAGEQ